MDGWKIGRVDEDCLNCLFYRSGFVNPDRGAGNAPDAHELHYYEPTSFRASALTGIRYVSIENALDRSMRVGYNGV